MCVSGPLLQAGSAFGLAGICLATPFLDLPNIYQCQIYMKSLLDNHVPVIGFYEGKFYILKGGDYSKKNKAYLLYFDGHYAAIKNMSRLLSMSNSKTHSTQHFCDNCLNGFDSEEKRNDHFKYCIDNKEVKIELPEKYIDCRKPTFISITFFHALQRQCLEITTGE